MLATRMKVAVFTATRAEYGLLYWLLKDIAQDAELELQLIVSGMHLSPEFGLTYQQIEVDGFTVDEKVEILLSADTASGTVKSMGLALIGLADAFSRLQPDVLVLLGDRFEALAAAQAAMIMGIPVVHLHGGEITEGATDDAIRHAITKLSYLHATSTETYRQRVIQLGESPSRVKNVGALGLEHIKRGQFMSLAQLSESLEFDLTSPYLLVTYHPVTLADEPALASFEALLQALDAFPRYQVILTYPNADHGGRSIIPALEAYAAKQGTRVLAIPSLGQMRYLSAVKYASVVVGNSSSGIIEVPSFKVPTVNIGARQRGRLAAASVINAQPNRDDIVEALALALSGRFYKENEFPVNPYGMGDSSAHIIGMIKAAEFRGVKPFHDLEADQLR